ncbi:MAG TPA: alpha-ketoglutarate-dependent dioxygenase AlkB [Pyrinomonadaceae bacterium]
MASTQKTIRLLNPPEGFVYLENFLPGDEEKELVHHAARLPLKEFEFHGYFGKRRTMSFGWHYDFADASLSPTATIPDFLERLRERAAKFAGLSPHQLPHVLVTEYSPGTPIGWHRDKAVFKDVIGISLLSSCTFRLRRRTATGWERYSLTLAPRSAYLLRGPVRTNWEHSIPAVERLRYSITFRSLRSNN